MTLKKIELHQETLSKLTHKAENQKIATANPDCSFIMTCPHPCMADANPRNH